MKKKEMKQKIEGLKKERDMLLYFNTQISGTAMTFAGFEQQTEGDPLKLDLAHLFLKFNILNFINFFNTIYYKEFKYSATPPLDIIEEWKNHLKDKLEPKYKELVDELRNDKNKSSYFQ